MFKVLFIGSNPQGHEGLSLEREITALQPLVSSAAKFSFLPECPIEDLPSRLKNESADIIHFSAHGYDGELALATTAGSKSSITASMLASFVPRDKRPQLFFLSACYSESVAADLAASGMAAIGFHGAPTVGAARTAAVEFYRGIFEGAAIDEALGVAQAILAAFNQGLSLKVFAPPGSAITQRQLVRVPTIVAEPNAAPKYTSQGVLKLSVNFGLLDAPRGTQRVIFATTDRRFMNPSDPMSWGLQSCDGADLNGRINWDGGWTDVEGDFRITVSCVTDEGVTFSASSSLLEALRRCSSRPSGTTASDKVFRAVIQALAP